jgi:organic hydroperoxide reductase OsmC/OhrA
MSQTMTYCTHVTWKGDHLGIVEMGNGPEMEFSAPPEAHGLAGVLTPEDSFVAAVNTCYMMMFIWACEKMKLNLISYDCQAEGIKSIELDRTEIFTHIRLFPKICLRADGQPSELVEVRARRAVNSAQKYSLVANSVRSEVSIEPSFEIIA